MMRKDRNEKEPHSRKNLKSFDGKIKKNFNSFAAISLILLIFLSILPYGSSAVWSEAIICLTVFTLCIFAVLKGRFSALETEYAKLFTPLTILALYSFFQGFATLLVRNEFLPSSVFFPVSFDLTASFWVAVKIFAFVCFIKLSLSVFRNNIKLLVWGLIAAGNFYALFGIFRYLIQNSFPKSFQNFIFSQLTSDVGFGTFVNQNHFAFLMLMTIGLNLCLLWRGNLENYQRYLLLLFSLIAWTALILTGSRGGIISSFGAIAVLIFFPVKTILQNSSGLSANKHSLRVFSLGKKLLIFAVISAVIVLGVVFIGQDKVVQRFEKLPLQLEDVNDLKGFQRIDVFKAAAEIIRENPFYGVGFGGFRLAVSEHIDISGQVVPEQAHNDYLEYITAGGAVALFPAVWFLIRFFALVKKRFVESSGRFSTVARLGAICGLTGAALHSLFDFGLQWMANLLFFAALLVIAVHKDYSNKAGKKELQESKNDLSKFDYFQTALFIGLIIVSTVFGYSRFALSHTKITSGTEANNLLKFPFDAEFYKKAAAADVKANNNIEAINNLKNAIKYTPDDYNLWLEAGKLQEAENQNEEASKSFRRAVELAPRYGEPHYQYGKFLFRTNDKKETFKELRYAFQRNALYFPEVAALAWRETGENGEKTTDLLSPLSLPETTMLGMFFLEKESYSSIVYLKCHNENLSRQLTNRLITKLLESREYYFAHLMNKDICKDSDAKFTGFENGDFESGDIDDGIGFDWRINFSKIKEVGVSLDKNTFASGSTSLRFDFNGDIKSKSPLLSQIFFVEKKQKYDLAFSYKTKELVTGGLPVLQIILKQKNSDGKISEIKISPENKDWTRTSAEILTDENTEAVEIRLSRSRCDQKLCPIFGQLWLDDFQIKEIKK